MAYYGISKALAVLALALAFCVHGALSGGVECENLNKDSCAFAVSSSGKRCFLERSVRRSGEEAYECRTSEIDAGGKLKDWVESQQCVDDCGLERMVLGISSDSLLEADFRQKLCSSQCYGGCPNIVDLYFSLAAAEGIFLPEYCEEQGGKARRGMVEIRSSGLTVASGPIESGSADGGFVPHKLMLGPAMPPFNN